MIVYNEKKKTTIIKFLNYSIQVKLLSLILLIYDNRRVNSVQC